YPTVTARLSFLVDVSSHSSQEFLIFYNNQGAKERKYKTGLHLQGDILAGMRTSNNLITAKLHLKSGVLNRIKLHSKPDAPLYPEAETNGAIQWNPDIYSPPAQWAHVSVWKSPHSKVVEGPVVVATYVWGEMWHYLNVMASVVNRFYPNKPYFI